MDRRAAFVLVMLTLVVVVSRAGTQPPRASLTHAGTIELVIPPDVLMTAEVKKQIRSGLTTAFLITVSGKAVEGGARIEIRDDLWNDKFVIETVDVTGRRQTFSATTDDELARWWRETPQVVIARDGADIESMSVRLRVLPFSAREQEETQRWLSRSLDSGRDRDPSGEKPTNAKLLEIIVGTSIRRRPILEYRWTVPIVRQAR